MLSNLLFVNTEEFTVKKNKTKNLDVPCILNKHSYIAKAKEAKDSFRSFTLNTVL